LESCIQRMFDERRQTINESVCPPNAPSIRTFDLL
jgi:hypothetical protein